jgi:hypothetical protein
MYNTIVDHHVLEAYAKEQIDWQWLLQLGLNGRVQRMSFGRPLRLHHTKDADVAEDR